MHDSLKVHRSVKTRLEARSETLSHPLSRHGEDTHVEVTIPRSVYDDHDDCEEGGQRGEKKGEVYVPQVRPHFAGKHSKPTRLSHAEWDVDVPRFWEWVD